MVPQGQFKTKYVTAAGNYFAKKISHVNAFVITRHYYDLVGEYISTTTLLVHIITSVLYKYCNNSSLLEAMVFTVSII